MSFLGIARRCPPESPSVSYACGNLGIITHNLRRRLTCGDSDSSTIHSAIYRY